MSASAVCDSDATFFAPAGRAAESELQASARAAEEDALLRCVAECVDGMLMVLNSHRQVLLGNSALLQQLGVNTSEPVVGKRPGEAIGCIHVSDGPDGCGTSRACAYCGAVLAIVESQESGRPVVQECLATVRRPEGFLDSVEFRVRAAPVEVGGERMTAFVLNDISGEKRREALERTFFHDILNTIGGLAGWSLLMERLDQGERSKAAQRIGMLTRRLEQEVKDQRRLRDAETGTLVVSRTRVPAAGVLEELQVTFALHEVAEGKQLVIESPAKDATVYTDVTLLLRVLTNMVKNALEAVPAGGTVRVWHAREAGGPAFFVHNPGAIPPDVALRIFKRSFSTKAEHGRGLGTYSMKLFGERYLGGKVGFESSAEAGTTFFIRLPQE